MILLQQIQERLIEAIKQSSLSQTEIAKSIGVCQPAVSYYIKGKKMPSLETLANLCKLLDADANYILCQDI